MLPKILINLLTFYTNSYILFNRQNCLEWADDYMSNLALEKQIKQFEMATFTLFSYVYIQQMQ